MRLVRFQIGAFLLISAASAQGGHHRPPSSRPISVRPVPRPMPPAEVVRPPVTSPAMAHVRALFEHGTAADPQETIGWFSGRCYFEGTAQAYSGLLVGWNSDEDGPLFPGQHKFSVIYAPSKPANYFDNIEVGGTEYRSFQEILDSRAPNVAISKLSDNALVSSMKSGDSVLSLHLRTKDSYRVVALLDDKEKAVGYCYHFKTIK